MSSLAQLVSCGASKVNTETGSPARPTIIVEKLTIKAETGSPARPTIIVEKLTVKLDAQQLSRSGSGNQQPRQFYLRQDSSC
jgi:hypothetical protein